MIRPASPDLAILRHLAARTHASAAEIGTACWMNAAEVHPHRVTMRSDKSAQATSA